MKIYVRDESGNFIIVPLGQLSSEDMAKTIAEYFQENPLVYTAEIRETNDVCEIVSGSYQEISKAFNNGATVLLNVTHLDIKGNPVLYRCCHLLMYEEGTVAQFGIDDQNFGYSYIWTPADKVTVSTVELVKKSDLNDKADKATTLEGYGITDAYTKYATDDLVKTKLEETVLYEDVVNTPEWNYQPTYEGELDASFNTDDFYYVTLKDADGNALPYGQFMLKDFYTDGATVYSTVFSLDDLYIGAAVQLIENYPVEFTEIGETVRMRDAGVWEAAYNPSSWKLNGNHGSLKLVCDGEFIQRTSTAYFISQFQTDKNVSHYHSVNTTAYQTDSDSRNMGVYISLNDGKSYKTNKFYNEFTITRISDTRYKTQRTVTLRYINFADGTPKVISAIEFGHGEIQQGETYLKKINVQVAAVTNRGFIRNGSVIRVSEVK